MACDGPLDDVLESRFVFYDGHGFDDVLRDFFPGSRDLGGVVRGYVFCDLSGNSFFHGIHDWRPYSSFAPLNPAWGAGELS